MRTKRKFAHEFYPHPDEYEVQPLEVAVPYLYARFVGLQTRGTDWHNLGWDPKDRITDKALFRLGSSRIPEMIEAKQRALLADALLQGMGGQEAWKWAEERAQDETGECAYERAIHYGVPVDQIKPYPVWEEPDHHDHLGPSPMGGDWQTVTRIDGKESECAECCEAESEATK